MAVKNHVTIWLLPLISTITSIGKSFELKNSHYFFHNSHIQHWGNLRFYSKEINILSLKKSLNTMISQILHSVSWWFPFNNILTTNYQRQISNHSESVLRLTATLTGDTTLWTWSCSDLALNAGTRDHCQNIASISHNQLGKLSAVMTTDEQTFSYKLTKFYF